jgi:hypothetical protein
VGLSVSGRLSSRLLRVVAAGYEVTGYVYAYELYVAGALLAVIVSLIACLVMWGADLAINSACPP